MSYPVAVLSSFKLQCFIFQQIVSSSRGAPKYSLEVSGWPELAAALVSLSLVNYHCADKVQPGSSRGGEILGLGHRLRGKFSLVR